MYSTTVTDTIDSASGFESYVSPSVSFYVRETQKDVTVCVITRIFNPTLFINNPLHFCRFNRSNY